MEGLVIIFDFGKDPDPMQTSHPANKMAPLTNKPAPLLLLSSPFALYAPFSTVTEFYSRWPTLRKQILPIPLELLTTLPITVKASSGSLPAPTQFASPLVLGIQVPCMSHSISLFSHATNNMASGLFSFAGTTFLLSLINVQTRGVKEPNVVVGMAIFVGGLAQLLAGMWEFPRGNVFGATGEYMFLCFLYPRCRRAFGYHSLAWPLSYYLVVSISTPRRSHVFLHFGSARVRSFVIGSPELHDP
jgi:hypothetical protein